MMGMYTVQYEGMLWRIGARAPMEMALMPSHYRVEKGSPGEALPVETGPT
jgi:hypothetical protein